MSDQLSVQKDDARLIIDARDMIRSGHHPRGQILSLVEEAPAGTLCEIHVPHKTAPLIAALKAQGHNVAVSEEEPGHFRIRLFKL